MKVFTRFSSDHKEFIHDVAYDYYGRRLATGSSDSTVKIWESVDGEGWKCTSEFKSHSGPVCKLAWAHPEFGQLLASCSTDRSVHIHEELADGNTEKPKWHKKGALNDATGALRDIAFSPRHHGLKLATISEDGKVRIYESSDVLNTANWNQWGQDIEVGPPNDESACLSWNTSTFDDMMLTIGYGRECAIWQYGAKVPQWQKIAALPHPDLVREVAWAPQMGRQYHLIATACKDKGVRVFKVTFDSKTNKFIVDDLNYDHSKQSHEGEVWRVCWNITGTVLASTGDDGKAKLWECDAKGSWKNSVTLSGRKQEAQQMRRLSMQQA
jgi:nucleoporin SEH1